MGRPGGRSDLATSRPSPRLLSRPLLSPIILLPILLLRAAPVTAVGSPAGASRAITAAEPELRRCLDSLVERHPALLAARADHEAARQRVAQAIALPDPVLNLSRSLRSVETRVGPQTAGVTLTQSFPWFGERELRGRVALSEAEARLRVAGAAEREIVARAKRVFYDLAYMDAALRLTDEERSLVGHYEVLARARYATGQGLQQAVIRLQAELTRISERRHQLEGERRVLGVRLNTRCGRAPDAPVPPIPPVERPTVALDRSHLLDLGERNRQELLAAAALVEAGEEAVELAGMSFRPRLTASLALMNVSGRDPRDAFGPLPPDEGRNAVSVSVGVSLPVWKESYRAGVEEAGYRLTAQRRRLEEVRDDMEDAVERALIRIETLDDQIALLDTVLIPQSEATLLATETAYQTGQVGVLDLLDSERVQIAVRRMRARYVSDFLIALADLERGVGVGLPPGDGRPS